jgi:hypothetical protein
MTTKHRKRHSPEQIVRKLRDADAMLNAGKELAAVLQSMEVSEATFHRWRAQYGGMSHKHDLFPPEQGNGPPRHSLRDGQRHALDSQLGLSLALPERYGRGRLPTIASTFGKKPSTPSWSDFTYDSTRNVASIVACRWHGRSRTSIGGGQWEGPEETRRRCRLGVPSLQPGGVWSQTRLASGRSLCLECVFKHSPLSAHPDAPDSMLPPRNSHPIMLSSFLGSTSLGIGVSDSFRSWELMNLRSHKM